MNMIAYNDKIEKIVEDTIEKNMSKLILAHSKKMSVHDNYLTVILKVGLDGVYFWGDIDETGQSTCVRDKHGSRVDAIFKMSRQGYVVVGFDSMDDLLCYEKELNARKSV